MNLRTDSERLIYRKAHDAVLKATQRQAPQVAMADRDQQELLRVVRQVADALVNAKTKCAAAQRSSSIRSTPADAAVLEGINRLVTKALEEAEKLL
jgi:transposase